MADGKAAPGKAAPGKAVPGEVVSGKAAPDNQARRDGHAATDGMAGAGTAKGDVASPKADVASPKADASRAKPDAGRPKADEAEGRPDRGKLSRGGARRERGSRTADDENAAPRGQAKRVGHATTEGKATSGNARQRNRHDIPLSAAAALVALGVVYGDLGTSPVYMTKAVVSGQGGLAGMGEQAVLGMLSLVIWTLTLITTVKYVLIAMHADNHGEGGIFALFAMVRRFAKPLAIPAMVGGAAFLADSVLTPAVAITSAVEGLRTIPAAADTALSQQGPLVAISIAIIAALFLFQQAGTTSIGRLFGPIMGAWFAFIAVAGIANLAGDLSVLRAFNPLYGIRFLLSPDNRAGIAILGSVFLTITGAEALYSDMGHVGRANIYATWPIVKVALILNYLGQGAWLLANQSNASLYGAPDLNPFFQMLPPEMRPVAVVFGVVAGVIASQALITGAFTLVAEAAHLNWMPRMRIFYPSATKGQLYIPFVNGFLWVATTAVILGFQTSHNMEAAYGLALTVTMLSTTILLMAHLWKIERKRVAAVCFGLFFGMVEAMFFASSLTKFFHGGYVTALMAAGLLVVMLAWSDGTRIEQSQRRRVDVDELLPSFRRLAEDDTLPLTAENLVYLTSDNEMERIDRDIVYSVFARRPRRAHAYWVVNIVIANEPYCREYSVDSFGTGYFFRVRMRLGYKVDQHLRAFMGQIMHDMVESGELTPQTSPYPDFNGADLGDTRYVVLHKELTPESEVPARARFAIRVKYAIRHFVGSPVQWYGLQATDPIIDTTPLFVRQATLPALARVKLRGQVLTPEAEAYRRRQREEARRP